MLSLANRAMSSFSDGFVGQNCKTKFRMLKNSGDVRCSSGVSGLMKSTVGAAGGRGFPEELRKRLRFVARLNFLHIIEIGGIEKLRAKNRRRRIPSRCETPS